MARSAPETASWGVVFPKVRRALPAVALLCSAPAGASVAVLGGAGNDAAAAPARVDARAAVWQYPKVTAARVAIRISGVDDPTVVTRASRVPGVAHATSVRIGRSRVGTGVNARQLTVAAVDPVEYRRFAPQEVADSVGVWQRLDAGELAVSRDQAERLGLQLARPVTLQSARKMDVRVGALATVSSTPLAQALVDRSTGARLGIGDAPPTVLVALDQGANPVDVAARLGTVLEGKVDVLGGPSVIAAETSSRPTRPSPRPSGSSPDSPTPRPSGSAHVPHPPSVAPTPVEPTPTHRHADPDRRDVWERLAACESGGNWQTNTGNGYYGGLQFNLGSWRLVGGSGRPDQASPAEQIARGEQLQARQGWRAWPRCSAQLGLR